MRTNGSRYGEIGLGEGLDGTGVRVKDEARHLTFGFRRFCVVSVEKELRLRPGFLSRWRFQRLTCQTHT